MRWRRLKQVGVFEPWLFGATPKDDPHSARTPRDLISADSEDRSRMTRHVERRHRSFPNHG